MRAILVESNNKINDIFKPKSEEELKIFKEKTKLLKLEKFKKLTPGQTYAVKMIEIKGLEFISTFKQIKRGTLMFKDNIIDNKYWALYKTGYIRSGGFKTTYYNNETTFKMGVIFNMRQPQYKKAGFITDEEYKELTDILLLKLVKAHKLYKKKNNIN